MKTRVFALLSAYSLLAACSGGLPKVTVLDAGTTSGFGLVRASSGDNTFVAAVRDVEDAAGLAAVSLASMDGLSADANGFVRGTVKVKYADGSVLDVPAYFYKDVAGIYGKFGDNTSQAIVVGGEKASALPIGTSFQYTGVAIMSYDTAALSSMTTEEGTFTLNANLITNQGNITANTAGASYNNSNLVFAADGTYSGANGTYSVPGDAASTRSVPIYGSLHGKSGTVVSGAGYAQRGTDDFAYIAIIGKRQ